MLSFTMFGVLLIQWHLHRFLLRIQQSESYNSFLNDTATCHNTNFPRQAFKATIFAKQINT